MKMDSNNKADVTIKTFGRIYKMSVNEAKTAILNTKQCLESSSDLQESKQFWWMINTIRSHTGSYDWENRYENGVWT